MIHKYSMQGTNILLDVYSGAIHIVDDLAYKLLDYMPKTDKQTLINNLQGQYTAEEVSTAYDELIQLRDGGLLFTEDEYEDIPNIFQKSSVIKAMCLHVSHDCNLRCKYCFAGTGDFGGARKIMSTETGCKAINFLVEHSGNRKNIEVDFFGGEPLMNMQTVKDIVKYIKDNEGEWGKIFHLTITTNGVQLNDDNMEFINKYMDNVVLSIDGRKETNDRMRVKIDGSGSYDVILPKLKKMADLRNQDRYYVRGTYTRNNLDFYEDVKHLAEQGFKQISVEPVVAPDGCGYELKQENLPQLFSQYEKLVQYYVEKWNTDEWFNFFHFMIDLEQGPCVAKRIRGCGAGHEYVAVTPEGDIFPCHQFVGMDDFKLGNVYVGDLNKELVDKFMGTNVYTKPECKKCWAKYYCSGGCHANAWNSTGSLEKPYLIGCELQKKRIECAIWAKSQGV